MNCAATLGCSLGDACSAPAGTPKGSEDCLCARDRACMGPLTFVGSLVTGILIVLSLTAKMGQDNSKGPLSPLECLMKNFDDFKKRAGSYGVTVNVYDLRKFCELEWPTFGVGWPDVGTFEMSIAARVRTVCYGNPGHPDQIPYIDTWIDIIVDQPSYLKDCGCRRKRGKRETAQVFLAEGADGGKKVPVLQPPPESPRRVRRGENPPPYRAPPVPTAPPRKAPREERESPDSTISSPHHTRSGVGFGAPEPPMGVFPLRETGERDEIGRPIRTYVPFTTSDLYNWKNQNPSFSEAPEEVITLLESVFYTHQPTWDDCQQLLRTLFTTEERERIRAEARKQVRDQRGEVTANELEIEKQFPSNRPAWDPNTRGGEEALHQYRQVFLRGLRAAARKPTNLTKVTDIRQGPDESPTAYLERLLQAYRTWTPIDPRAPENQPAVVLQFVSQSAPDIRKKLQRLDGFQGKSLSELVAIAQKVYDQREDPVKTTQELTQKMAKVLLAKEGKDRKGGPRRGKGNGRKSLGKNQCAYCKEEGHWKKDCPQLKEKKTKSPVPVLVEEVD